MLLTSNDSSTHGLFRSHHKLTHITFTQQIASWEDTFFWEYGIEIDIHNRGALHSEADVALNYSHT